MQHDTTTTTTTTQSIPALICERIEQVVFPSKRCAACLNVCMQSYLQ